jgi:hypothetical protein
VKKRYYWNIHEFRVARFNRPFHTTAIVYFAMDKWRDARASDLYRNLYANTVSLKLPVGQIDDDLFNTMQLDVQMITLPENVAFCSRYSEKEVAATAFSMIMCDHDSAEFLGKEYEEIRDAAAQKY